jgi:hypothetical protein
MVLCGFFRAPLNSDKHCPTRIAVNVYPEVALIDYL